uniref:Uncharacterized protein n=1 Tax=Serinus canaria TaxID=9135 RepID=A0A8C9N0Q7_SERCA
MSQIRRAPRHFVLSSYPNGAPEEETYSNLQTIPDTTEQMEFDISSATQVGRQLALIGDEFNRRYHRTLEETLLHLARVVAISVFQTCNVIKSIIRSCGDVSSNWTKRITGCRGWVHSLPFLPPFCWHVGNRTPDSLVMSGSEVYHVASGWALSLSLLVPPQCPVFFLYRLKFHI